jgi:Cu/Zn superoxide dismutase
MILLTQIRRYVPPKRRFLKSCTAHILENGIPYSAVGGELSAWCVLQERTAVVTLYKGTDAVGDITFVQEQDGGPVKLSGTVSGLSPGKHGFHVHERGELRNECVTAGGHFNPEKVGHSLRRS